MPDKRDNLGNVGIVKQDSEFFEVALRQVLKAWKAIVICMLLGALLAAGVYSILPVTWQATLEIRVGRVPQAVDKEGMLIESIDQVATRLRSDQFSNEVVKALGYPNLEAGVTQSDAIHLLVNSLRANAVRNTDLVTVNFRGYDKTQMQDVGASIAKTLLLTHNKIFEDSRESLSGALNQNGQSQAQNQASRTRLEKQFQEIQQLSTEQRLTAGSLLSSQLQASALLRADLRREQRDLERMSLPTVLYPTQVSATYIDMRPSSASLAVCVSLGLIVGLVLGMFAVLLQAVRRP